MKHSWLLALILLFANVYAQDTPNTIIVNADSGKYTIMVVSGLEKNPPFQTFEVYARMYSMH